MNTRKSEVYLSTFLVLLFQGFNIMEDLIVGS